MTYNANAKGLKQPTPVEIKEVRIGLGRAAMISLPLFAAFVVLASVFLRASWERGWSWWPLVVGALAWALSLAIGLMNGSIRACGSVTPGVARLFFAASLILVGGFYVELVGWQRIKTLPVWALAGWVIGAVVVLVLLRGPREK